LVRDTNPLVRVGLGDTARPDWILVLVFRRCAEVELRPHLGDPPDADNDARCVLVKRIAVVAVVEDEGTLRLQLPPEPFEQFPLAIRLKDPPVTPRIIWPSDR